MTQKEFSKTIIDTIFTWYIDSSSTPLLELLQEACSQHNKQYLKIHDSHTNKTYSFQEAKRILKLNQL